METNKLINCIKGLADPTRMKLLDLIRKGTQCNCEFSESLELPPNLISHHLRILRKCGLVETEKDPLDARWVYYSINKDTFSELREFLYEFLDPAEIQDRALTCGPSSSLMAIAENFSDIKK